MKPTLNTFQQVAQVLIENGNHKCIANAALLEDEFKQSTNLHLRGLELSSNNVISIANILKTDKNSNLTSISFSYNAIGDQGAIALAESFPYSIREIGMVSCDIGDLGGKAILQWAKNASTLQMICIEQNNFSASLRKDFKKWKMSHPKIMVII